MYIIFVDKLRFCRRANTTSMCASPIFKVSDFKLHSLDIWYLRQRIYTYIPTTLKKIGYA